MSVVFRSLLLPLRAPLPPLSTPALSFHTSPSLSSPRWRKYRWTPWPWHVGLKCRRNPFPKNRHGYMRLRREPCRPGAHPGQITGPYCQTPLTAGFTVPAVLYEEAGKILRLLVRQCEVYAVQRARRARELLRMYGGGYYRRILGGMLMGMADKAQGNVSRSLLAFAGFVVFGMDKRNLVITETELEKCFEELGQWSTLVRENQTENLSEWESVAKHPSCHVWQRLSPSPVANNRPSAGSSSAEYRALGTMPDIPARIFYKTQLDLHYRKQWDKLVIKLEVIDADEQTGTETLQWVSQFPFPFSPREYVYQRRHKLDEQRNAILVISKSCDHPKCPPTSSYVRVSGYYSALLIKPHRNFDENGFDYVLSYLDDPQTFLPKMAVQYAAKSSLPDFMNKLHEAARVMLNRKRKATPPSSSVVAHSRPHLDAEQPAPVADVPPVSPVTPSEALTPETPAVKVALGRPTP
ncbi:stAR-related lipid transfer protein 7, mitochondrial-like [Paramacrobiotus metropolitanus]|uniref:stAR-related lipid transfer protein 7, mitochondrial-like n=1 Tax=Paramacrobiotus metropolitanus TaxID=2943436 RepID=UPI002445CD6D|nr:stAR-related lipid transfer protein 7, mitochondrial-like [Paramacrobiotus metropolitanus]